MSNIYLVGFMGTGKSAVGRRLAQRKNWQFVDLAACADCQALLDSQVCKG